MILYENKAWGEILLVKLNPMNYLAPELQHMRLLSLNLDLLNH